MLWFFSSCAFQNWSRSSDEVIIDACITGGKQEHFENQPVNQFSHLTTKLSYAQRGTRPSTKFWKTSCLKTLCYGCYGLAEKRATFFQRKVFLEWSCSWFFQKKLRLNLWKNNKQYCFERDLPKYRTNSRHLRLFRPLVLIQLANKHVLLSSILHMEVQKNTSDEANLYYIETSPVKNTGSFQLWPFLGKEVLRRLAPELTMTSAFYAIDKINESDAGRSGIIQSKSRKNRKSERTKDSSWWENRAKHYSMGGYSSWTFQPLSVK